MMGARLSRWMRRLAHRLDPIRGQWNGEFFDGIQDYEQAWLVIETDGTTVGTVVKINGKQVANCVGVTFSIGYETVVAKATVDLEHVPIHFIGQLKAEPETRRTA